MTDVFRVSYRVWKIPTVRSDQELGNQLCGWLSGCSSRNARVFCCLFCFQNACSVVPKSWGWRKGIQMALATDREDGVNHVLRILQQRLSCSFSTVLLQAAPGRPCLRQVRVAERQWGRSTASRTGRLAIFFHFLSPADKKVHFYEELTRAGLRLLLIWTHPASFSRFESVSDENKTWQAMSRYGNMPSMDNGRRYMTNRFCKQSGTKTSGLRSDGA